MAARATKSGVLALALAAGALVAVLAWLLVGDGRAPEEPSSPALVPGLGPAEAASARADAPLDAQDAERDPAAAAERPGARTSLASAAPAAELRTWSALVVDRRDGRPVEGARVALARGEERAAAVSDADGAFALEWPVGLAADLAVDHERYADLREPAASLEDGRAIALAPSGALHGHVRSASAAALAGAEVALWRGTSRRYDGEPLARTDAGEDGAFRFDDLAPGEYALGAHHATLPMGFLAGLAVAPAQETYASLVLASGLALRGRVVSSGAASSGGVASGEEPVAGATVELRPEIQGTNDGIEERSLRRLVAGPDGRFATEGLGHGAVDVLVRTPWAARIERQVDVSYATANEERTLRVPAPARLAGRVVAPDGRGVGGALVALAAGDLASAIDAESAAAALAAPPGEARAVIAARAGADGSFVLERVPAEQRIAVVAFPPAESADLRPGSQRLDDLPAGAEAPEIELRLVGVALVRGRVLDPELRPLAGAEVEIDHVVAGAWRTSARTTSAADGTFALEGVPASLGRVVASHAGYGRESRRIDGEAEQTVELVLAPRSVLAGVVVDREGAAVPGARVSATSGRRDQRGARADEYGRFELEGLREGTWSVVAQAQGWRAPEGEPLQIELPCDVALRLVLEPDVVELASLAGEVVLAQTNEPVPRLRLAGLRGGTVTRDGTRFFVSGTGAGTVTVSVRTAGYERFAFERVTVPASGHVELGSIAIWDGMRAEVDVLDERGRRLEDARVVLIALPVSDGGAGEDRGRLGLSYDGRGRRYEREGVARRDWRLLVTHDGYRRHVQRVSAERWDARVRVRLVPKTGDEQGSEAEAR